MLERGLLSRILFPAPPPSYSAESFPEELIWVPKGRGFDGSSPPLPDAESLPCLLMTYPSARFLIIFFHSNAEDLGRCRGFCCYIREQFQVHVLAVEYPGYGICPGVPTGESVMENAFAALRFARESLHWPLDSIKVFGRSIGTGPAIGLASSFTFAGLILVTPFLSVQELFRDRVGPFAGLVEEWFANEDGAAKIASPTMIIHGQRDELITCRHGESLFKILTCRKMLVSPPEMEHNTNLLTNLHIFVLPMFQFFALPDYVFQDMKVPAWAYDKRAPTSKPEDDFEVEADESSRLCLHPEVVRPRAASAPRRSISEYATPKAHPLMTRALSASGARPSPRKVLTASSDRALVAELREQQWREAVTLPGPRPALMPMLGIDASRSAAQPPQAEAQEPGEEPGAARRCTRNLAMDLLPEDPSDASNPDFAVALATAPEALLGSPRMSGRPQDPTGEGKRSLRVGLEAELEAPLGAPGLAGGGEPAAEAAAGSEEPSVAATAQKQASAHAPSPAEGAAADGSAVVADLAVDGSAAGASSASAEEKEEAIRRLTEFAGAMCDGELCSDRLVANGDLDATVRELTGHKKVLATIAERQRLREASAPGCRLAWSSPQEASFGSQLAARPRSSDDPRVEPRSSFGTEAFVAARQRGRGGNIEDSVWTRWCGRSTPNLDLHEARDGGTQPQRQRWAAHGPGNMRRPQVLLALGEAPPVLERPSRLGEDSQLSRCGGRAPLPLLSSCCRGLPPEAATDLLSPKPARGTALPEAEELLEHLGPAAFLLPRRKRLSI